MPNLKIASEFWIIHYNELKLRLETIYEHRKSVRISLGKHHAILRQPLLLTSAQKEKNQEWARNWVIKKFEQDPVLRQRYTPKDYQTGQKFNCGNAIYIRNKRKIRSQICIGKTGRTCY